MADALMASLEIIASEPYRRQKVLEVSTLLRLLLYENGIDVERTDSPIIPIIIGENDRAISVAAELQTLGLDIRAIPPPTVPQGTARLRVSVHFDLSEDTIHSFIHALNLAMTNAENKSCSVAYL